jgi:beta-mannosidase
MINRQLITGKWYFCGVKFQAMNRFFSLLILGFLVLSSKCISAQDFNLVELDGGWKFRRAGTKEWMPAKVPGTVHLDLMRNKMIPDPYLHDNEEKLQWIGETGWEYSKTFQYAEEKFAWRHI